MGIPKAPRPALLFISLLYRDSVLIDEVLSILENKFGSIAKRSPVLPFEYTNYYLDEMGPGLKRMLIAHEKFVDRQTIVDTKIFTNEIEIKWTENDKRQVNLDPGLLNFENIQLASTKAHAHRVYMGKGINVETTLLFKKGKILKLPWTYPDYAEGPVAQFLLECRSLLDPLRHIVPLEIPHTTIGGKSTP